MSFDSPKVSTDTSIQVAKLNSQHTRKAKPLWVAKKTNIEQRSINENSKDLIDGYLYFMYVHITYVHFRLQAKLKSYKCDTCLSCST